MNFTTKFVENVKAFIKKHPKVSITLVVLSLLLLLLSVNATGTVPLPAQPTPTPTPLTQQPFRVTGTYPAPNETNVYPGEIQITANTNVPIVSKDAFTINISPKLPYYWELNNVYPTNTIAADVFGFMEKGTKYTVTITGKNNYFYSWSFTTGEEAIESSSNLERVEEEAFIKKEYPLLDYVPYTTDDLTVDYTKENTLEVNVFSSDLSEDEVKQIVETWIKEHGVDPSTQTINYNYSYADY